MQNITLEFKKLDKLPVPESRDEILFKQTGYIDASGQEVIEVYRPIGNSGDLEFNLKFEPALKYAHVKVTASETDFKVGDRVKWKGYNGEIVASLRESDGLLFEYKTPEFVMGFNGLKTNQVVVHPKELTIITQ